MSELTTDQMKPLATLTADILKAASIQSGLSVEQIVFELGMESILSYVLDRISNLDIDAISIGVIEKFGV